jgi:hypothetical protein
LYPVTCLDKGLVAGVNDATTSDHGIAIFGIAGSPAEDVIFSTGQQAEIIASDV